MDNVNMSVDGNILTIEIDVSKRLGPSKSGKTEIIATTGGNMAIPEFRDVKIGINCYTKKESDNG